VPGPRYTSYPTADRFVEAFGEDPTMLQALEQRRTGPAAQALPLSLYVHIPFCESLCYYCACNKIITKHHDRGAVPALPEPRDRPAHRTSAPAGRSASCIWVAARPPSFSDDELRS
jgi:oxygen-independent coproporphyrinogen-3 oxidase